MGRNILFLSVLCLLIFETTAVQMCTNQSSTGKDVSLNLNTGAGVSGCNCSVKWVETDNIGSVYTKMYFEVVKFSGCKYKLVVFYKDRNITITCSNNNTTVYYDINKSDETQLYLKPTNSHDETTIFEMKINSSADYRIRLDCFSPTTTITTTSNSTPTSPPVSTSTQITTSTPTPTQVTTSTQTPTQVTTSTQPPTQESTKATTLTPTPTQESMSTSTQVSTQESSSSSSSVSMTGSTPKSVTPTVTRISNKPATGNDMNEKKTGGATNHEGDDIDIGIIGGAIGGGLLLIILIIIIIICVVKKRKKNHEKKDYNRPTVTGSQHDYTDIDLVAKDNNSSPRQYDNTDQKANSPVVMEIIENDLYVSSDDIMDLKSRDNNNTNQKTDAIDSKSRDNNNTNQKTDAIDSKSRDNNNTNQKMDANNGPAENSTSHDNGGPLYAAVNKKPTSLKSDQTDKSNGIAGVTDIDLGTKDNNSSSRQSDNTEQNTNSTVAIEMDPKSCDDNNTKTDAIDSKSRDNNKTNPKTDAKNGPAEMEIIENDLYVSSGDPLNSHDNDGPLYSSVNKKPKSPQTDNSNGITGEDHDTLL